MRCPMCDGTGTTWMGLENEVECSYCNGEGVISDKKLYTVSVSTTLIVWAEDAHDAANVAHTYAAEELDNAEYHVDLTDEVSLPYEWEDSYPYGESPVEFDDLTLREIYKRKKVIQEALEMKDWEDPNQLGLFE